MTQACQLALFAGAGFSKWAGNLPIVSELFDFGVELFGPRDKRKMEIVRSAKAVWDAQHTENLPEQFIAHALTQPDIRDAVLWYIVRRLSEPYIWREWHAGRWRRHVLMIDENRKFERPGVTRARDFLFQLQSRLLGIITTNYDLLAEYALGTRLFNYGRFGEVLTGRGAYPVSQWRNPVTLRGSTRLAKMHGSISWDTNGRYTDGRGGITGDALIVAPTPEKKPPAALASAWALAGEILRDSNSLLVFGFAFNPYDEALTAHLQEHGRGIRRVVLVDKYPRSDRAKSIWPDATVHALGPPPEGQLEYRNWLLALDRLLDSPAGNTESPTQALRSPPGRCLD
jgi:hypothetical protein